VILVFGDRKNEGGSYGLCEGGAVGGSLVGVGFAVVRRDW